MLVPYFPHASWIMLFFCFWCHEHQWNSCPSRVLTAAGGQLCVLSSVLYLAFFSSKCLCPSLVGLTMSLYIMWSYIYNTHLITFIYSIVPDSGSARSCFIFYLCMQPLRPWESLNLFRLLDSFESFICFRAAGFDMLRLRLEWTKWPMFWRTAGSRWL